MAREEINGLGEINSFRESNHDNQNRFRETRCHLRYRCCYLEHPTSHSRSQSRSQSRSHSRSQSTSRSRSHSRSHSENREEGRHLLDVYRKNSSHHVDIGEFEPIRKYWKDKGSYEDIRHLTKLQREHLESGTDTCCYGCFKGIGQSGQIYWSDYTLTCTCMMGYYQDHHHSQGISNS